MSLCDFGIGPTWSSVESGSSASGTSAGMELGVRGPLEGSLEVCPAAGAVLDDCENVTLAGGSSREGTPGDEPTSIRSSSSSGAETRQPCPGRGSSGGPASWPPPLLPPAAAARARGACSSDPLPPGSAAVGRERAPPGRWLSGRAPADGPAILMLPGPVDARRLVKSPTVSEGRPGRALACSRACVLV
jgi:hypothetical protein